MTSETWNTISKSFIAIPWKFKCPLTCPVSKCAFVKHFETLISSLIQESQCHSEVLRLLHRFYLLFFYGTCKGTFTFPWNSDKAFAFVFLCKIFDKRIILLTIIGGFHGIYLSFCKIPFLQPESRMKSKTCVLIPLTRLLCLKSQSQSP